MKIVYGHIRTVEVPMEAGPGASVTINAMMWSADAKRMGYRILPCGGETWCTVMTDNGHVVAEGRALCSPKDNFSKAKGRMIALGRAADSMGLKPEVVTAAASNSEAGHVLLGHMLHAISEAVRSEVPPATLVQEEQWSPLYGTDTDKTPFAPDTQQHHDPGLLRKVVDVADATRSFGDAP